MNTKQTTTSAREAKPTAGPTPETDAEARVREIRNLNSLYTVEEVGADFARKLERQRNELLSALDTIANPRRGHPEEFWNVEQIADFARAAIDRFNIGLAQPDEAALAALAATAKGA